MPQLDNNTESHKGTQLTLGEMHKIEGYKAEKHFNREIARLLGRSPQTINDAIKKRKHRPKTATGTKWQGLHLLQQSLLGRRPLEKV